MQRSGRTASNMHADFGPCGQDDHPVAVAFRKRGIIDAKDCERRYRSQSAILAIEDAQQRIGAYIFLGVVIGWSLRSR